MTESPHPSPESSSGDESPTSDRLYTPEQLEEFAREQLAAATVSRPVRTDPLPDPLSDPLTDPYDDGSPAVTTEPAPEAEPAADPAAAEASSAPEETAPVEHPTSDQPGSLLDTGWPQASSEHDAGRLTPLPTAPLEGSAAPLGPPPSAPPPSAMPSAMPPSGPPSAPPSAPPAGYGAGLAMPPSGATGPSSVPPAAPPSGPAQPDPRAFMTATDFLDRRDSEKELGPATWGWRGRVRRWSGGLIKPTMGPKEQAYEADRAQIQRDFDGPRTIAFVNPKGGAAKTTGVLAAGFTFGTVRGGGVIAWDNNETRGTLGIRGTRGSHRATTRELLEDLQRFNDPTQSRIGDLGAFVRSQGDAHFDVLASDERPDVTGMIHATDFAEIHKLLERFYRIILVDTGNNMRAENWLAAADSADLLVVTSTVREDTGYSGLWMLDALEDAGMHNLKYRTVTVLSDPSAQVDQKLAADLVSVYEQRTRAVYRVPYDPALVAGSVVPYSQLSEATRMSWLRACAGMASAL